MEKTVQKALAILEVLARSSQPRKLTDIARQLDLTKPNVHRLLGTLTELGFVRKDLGTSLYMPTLKLWELGMQLVREADLSSVAYEPLRTLAMRTGESVQLVVLDAGEAVCVDLVASSGPLKAVTRLGTRSPAYATAMGKALLAWASAETLDLALRDLQPFTPRTMLDRAQIEADLARTRKRGYAINAGEWREGVGGIAATIRDSTGAAVAAVSIWGAEDALVGPRTEELAGIVTETATLISQGLGYVKAAPRNAWAEGLKPK